MGLAEIQVIRPPSCVSNSIRFESIIWLKIVQCAPEGAKNSLNTALRNTREMASQFSLSFFVLWTHAFSLLAHREFWYVPSTPRGSVGPIFPRDGPFSVTV